MLKTLSAQPVSLCVKSLHIVLNITQKSGESQPRIAIQLWANRIALKENKTYKD